MKCNALEKSRSKMQQVTSQFPRVCCYQILLKLDNIWPSFCKSKKGDVFLRHSVHAFI